MENKKTAIIVSIFIVIFLLLAGLIGLAGKIPFLSKPLVFIFAIILVLFVLGFFRIFYNYKHKEKKMKILVSACLLGENCKYNGGNNKNENVIKLGKKHTLIPICPETFACLPTPRVPSEIRDGRVYSKNGEDLTEAFYDGAEKALYVAEETGCQTAILKERSPSCGFGKIYDGTFSGTLTYGNGIAAQMLFEHGIKIYGESDIKRIAFLDEET